jgi:hypothetical protein
MRREKADGLSAMASAAIRKLGARAAARNASVASKGGVCRSMPILPVAPCADRLTRDCHSSTTSDPAKTSEFRRFFFKATALLVARATTRVANCELSGRAPDA